MTLKKIKYKEFVNASRYWEISTVDFDSSNLIVGKNSSGKTRLINVISSLMNILSGKMKKLPVSGEYDVEMYINNKQYLIVFEFNNADVIKESIEVDGINYLERNSDGKGKIYYAKEDKYLDFELEKSDLAIQSKRDKLQHPYIIEVSDWAASSSTYKFGTEFGRDTFRVGVNPLESNSKFDKKDNSDNETVGVYISGFEKYGHSFDESIIKDMKYLGYELIDINAGPIDPSFVSTSNGLPLIGITVREKGVGSPIPQLFISQGMWRALALVINLNFVLFSKNKGLILVDDLGEGLDYERALNAVKLTMEKAYSSEAQVIVTSNDRFVMNAVPLDKWIILKREGPVVEAYTSKNSKEKFDNFKYTGLSNFDLFTSDIF